MPNNIHLQVDADGVALVTLDVEARSVNVYTPAFTQDLQAAVEAIASRSDIVGAVIASGKPSGFMAGADLLDFVHVHARGVTPREAAAVVAPAAQALRDLERCGKPVAVAIDGFALGGGFELCLACHYRVLVDDPRALVGLPEVTVGLLPGGGGTQRLPRLIGIAKALPLLLTGRHVAPAEALQLGMVDALVPAAEAVATARAWVLAHPGHRQAWDRKGYQVPGGAGALAAHATESFSLGLARIRRDTQDNEPAPAAILACVYEGTQLPIDRALTVEAGYFGQLLAGPVARNLMRTMFIHSGAARKRVRRPPGVARQPVRRLGVLGSGPLATAMAGWAARAGIDVVPLELAEADAGWEALRACDFIVDAVAGDTGLKASVHRQALEALGALPEGVVWATTDARQNLSDRAARRPSPEAVVGLQFAAPLESAGVVEIVRHRRTNAQTLARTLDFVAQLKMLPIVVNDGPGAYSGQLFNAYAGEGKAMREEGVLPALIQNAARQAGFRTPPLDLAGAAGTVPPATVQPPLAEVKNRLLYATALASVRCFEAGAVTEAADADLGAVLVLGYPRWTGGTLSFIETVGLSEFVAECDRLAGRYGERFRPTAGLRERAAAGQTFHPTA